MFDQSIDIEQSLIYGIPDEELCFIDYLGIEGNIAPTGMYIEY